MKITYDKVTDTLTILLIDSPVHESNEESEDMIFDRDQKGNMVGIEILNASKRIKDPEKVDFKIT